MAEVYKKRIIKLLKHADYRPVRLAQFARALDVDSEDYPQFKAAFEQLREAGHVVIGARNLIMLPVMSGRVTGTFRANPKGFGFVIPLEVSSPGDLYIPRDATGGAMTGDIVSVRVARKGKRAGQMRYSGKIIEILQRRENRFVGTLAKEAQGWMVHPDGTAFVEPISVDDVTAKGAKVKDKVIVEILSYPTEDYLARGVIIEVLGKAGRYDSEIKSIIARYRLPGELDDSCLKQARRVCDKFDAAKMNGREDITKKTIITIDPPDAKDFDDAISMDKDEDGNWVLGVHIADVSSFILPGTPLDAEAKSRGNSVYLPAMTIPMLPEILSNGICSLQPDQKRYCKSAYITYDAEGNVIGRRFANSVMCSTKRLTYTQADKILKGRTKDIAPDVVKLLKNMEALSRQIEKRRLKNGMLELELPDTELIMDKSGRVVDACPADTSYPHKIIEMFMVEANEAVAAILDKKGMAFMRRIHPEPDSLSMKNVARLVKSFGLTMPRRPDRYAMQNLLAAVVGKDCSFAVNLVVLRSFEKAQYSPLNIGHYALASTHYCHFTSPIRRYADLLVHRLLDTYLQDISEPAEALSEQDLTEIGSHITFTEQQAEDAERELKKVLILQMLSKRIGDSMDCVVTGLAGFGVFVQCLKFGIEGLIVLGDLGPDDWKFNAKTQCVVGAASGASVRLGTAMKVRIVSVNVPARQLNVSPVEPLAKSARGRKSETTKESPRGRTRKGPKGRQRSQRRTRGKGRR